jgi:hypothetical protein
MAATPIRASAKINAGFSRSVSKLAKEGHTLVRAEQMLTERILTFGQDFRSLSDQAKSLDGADDGAHQTFLRERLVEVAGTRDKAILSRWNTIGSQAAALLPFAKALPAQRDSLYELALATKQGHPVATWIKQELVSPHTTVRQLAALRKPPQKKKRKKKIINRVSVTMQFDGNFGEVAKLLHDVIVAKQLLSVHSHPALREAVKADLGAGIYETIKDRFD